MDFFLAKKICMHSKILLSSIIYSTLSYLLPDTMCIHVILLFLLLDFAIKNIHLHHFASIKNINLIILNNLKKCKPLNTILIYDR